LSGKLQSLTFDILIQDSVKYDFSLILEGDLIKTMDR
jgi:hypothetical protein